MKRIIKDFTSKEQYIKVLDKLKEYEGIQFDGSMGYNWYDENIKLFIDDLSMSHSNSSILYDGYKFISADDYLHPVKLNDIVELQDDSKYSGNIYIVTYVGDDDLRLEHGVSKTIWRDKSLLSVIKTKFKIGDKIIDNDGNRNIIKGIEKYITEELGYVYTLENSSGVYKEDYLTLQSINDLTSDLTIGIGSEELLTEDKISEIISNMKQDGPLNIKEDNILKTNNKPMNNTIKTEILNAATERYFDNKKNIKVISDMNTELQESIDLLNEAEEDINNKILKMIYIREKLNDLYRDKNYIEIEQLIKEYKQVKEFISVYIKNTVKQLGTVEQERDEFDVSEFFNN